MTLESQFGLNLNPNKPISEQTDRLSVIVLGFDSTSQLNFIRRMPKSLGFLQNNLKAIKLRGYNKVGENTLPNLVPLLSGKIRYTDIVRVPASKTYYCLL
jgi:hypothetical protein